MTALTTLSNANVSRFARPAETTMTDSANGADANEYHPEPLPAGHAVIYLYEDSKMAERRRLLKAQVTVNQGEAAAEEAELNDDAGDGFLVGTSLEGTPIDVRELAIADWRELGVLDLINSTAPSAYEGYASNGGGAYLLPTKAMKSSKVLGSLGITHLWVTYRAQAAFAFAQAREAQMNGGRNAFDRFGGRYNLPRPGGWNARNPEVQKQLNDARVMKTGRGRQSFGFLFPSIAQAFIASNVPVAQARLSRVQALLGTKAAAPKASVPQL